MLLEGEITFSRQLAQRTTRAWLFARLQVLGQCRFVAQLADRHRRVQRIALRNIQLFTGQLLIETCLLYTSDAADE